MGKIFLHDQTRESSTEHNRGATLTVNCQRGTVVKVVCGQTEYTVTADGTNQAVFKNLHNGTWTVSAVVYGQNKTRTVNIVTEYDIVMDFFTATIAIEYPEGSVCTCTNGIVTYTAPDTSGMWYCEVSDSGTWTISCTDGSRTKQDTVEIVHANSYVEAILSYFTAFIDVTYPSGAICSCSNGDITYYASDDLGEWTFKVYKAGDWTITANDGIQTATSTVTVDYDGQVKSTTIKFFSSVIDITYPEGATCTCTDGTTTFTAPNTSGKWIVSVPRIGIWTIRAFKGNNEAIQTVSITADGQSKSVICEFFASYIAVVYPKGTFKVVLWYINDYGIKVELSVDSSGEGNHVFMVEQTGSYEIGIYRVSPYIGIESEAKDYSSETVAITEDKQTVNITMSYVTVPEFTYTGTYKLTDDLGNDLTTTDGDWCIRFLTTGNFKFTKLNGASNGIDVFVLGGGGNGGESTIRYVGDNTPYSSGGGGGGGGYRTTAFGVQVEADKPYEIVVGAANGSSSAFEVSANGGSNGGNATDVDSTDSGGEGGEGGSKGGKGGGVANKGGDGEDGTYAFIGSSGYRFGAGGGGGYGYNGMHSEQGPINYGGKDSGGDSGQDATAPNTGGGGGGENNIPDQHFESGKGASGIVIIRNKR